jgi:oligosaccharide amylase
MPVYQPSAIVGNGQSLVSLGDRGEIMGFFYPHIDFPQNLREGMVAVYFGHAGHGHLCWTFEPTWHGAQRYLPRGNAVETQLFHAPSGLELRIVDFVHPRRDLMVRRFTASNSSAQSITATIYQYLDFNLGEVGQRNALRYLPDQHLAIQYWRNLAFAIGGSPFSQVQCGKDERPNSAKLDMEDGRLAGQAEEIGDVDLAVGWHFRVAPGKESHHTLLIMAAPTEAAAVQQLHRAKQAGFDRLLRATELHWATHADQARRVRVDPDIEETYDRSLLAIPLLFDQDYGAPVAAPEFDPEFTRSGGYGFCWPRDAAEVMVAMDAAGYRELGDQFIGWARRTQRPAGYWEQRYWLSGEQGPSWSTIEQGLQIDQTASVVWMICRHYCERANELPPAALDECWHSVRHAVDYLAHNVDHRGLHLPAGDVWESFQGTFTYTQAAIHAALLAGARFAEHMKQPRLADRWRELAPRVKAACVEQLWNGKHFARGLTRDGALDATVDSCTLGVLEPFDMLSLEDDRERGMVESLVEVIVERLGMQMPSGLAIARFEGDSYLGGAAGGVNTLWLARVLLRLARFYRDRDRSRSDDYRRRALEHMRVVRAHATTTGLLPELIGGGGASTGWAHAHGWAMASWIEATLLLDALDGAETVKQE